MTLLFLAGALGRSPERSPAGFLALVAVFMALVIYRPVPQPTAEGGSDARHPS